MLGGKCLLGDDWWKMSVGREMPLEFVLFVLMILNFTVLLLFGSLYKAH